MRPRPLSFLLKANAHGGAAAEDDDVQPSPPDEHPTTVGVPQDGPTSEGSAYATTSPVYNGPARLLKWSMSGSEGATVRLHLGEPGASEDHPFRGMRWGKENGQLLRAVVSTPREVDEETTSVPAGTPIYTGEGIVLWWADDCANGMSVKIGLNDGPDGTSGRHPFYGLKEGKNAGEPLILVAWTVADDDTPQEPYRVRRRVPFRDLGPVRQSQILCRDDRFQSWLRARARSLTAALPTAEGEPAGDAAGVLDIIEAAECPGADPKVFADAFVRRWCGVHSRAVMNREGDEATAARRQWSKLLSAYEDDTWGRR